MIHETLRTFKRNYLIGKGKFLMCPSNPETLGGYGFRFLNALPNPPVQLNIVGHERRAKSDYYFDNTTRTEGWLFQYTVSGCGTARIKNKIVSVPPGSAFLFHLPGDTGYYYDETTQSEPWEFYFAIFLGEAVRPYCEHALARYGDILHLGDAHPTVEKLKRLLDDSHAGIIRDPFSASSRIFDFVCSLCAAPETQKQPRSPLVERAIFYLRENFRRPIGLQDACAFLSVSQSHFSRTFFRETGSRPIEYLTRLRLEEAVRLLTESKLPLCEVSRRSGFSDANYFSKVFRQHLKLSPSEFRREAESRRYTAVRI